MDEYMRNPTKKKQTSFKFRKISPCQTVLSSSQGRVTFLKRAKLLCVSYNDIANFSVLTNSNSQLNVLLYLKNKCLNEGQ